MIVAHAEKCEYPFAHCLIKVDNPARLIALLLITVNFLLKRFIESVEQALGLRAVRNVPKNYHCYHL